VGLARAKAEIPLIRRGDIPPRELNAGIENVVAQVSGNFFGSCGMKSSRFIVLQTMVVPVIVLGTIFLQLGNGSANANKGLALDKKLSGASYPPLQKAQGRSTSVVMASRKRAWPRRQPKKRAYEVPNLATNARVRHPQSW
jgi:hypothetical protein